MANKWGVAAAAGAGLLIGGIFSSWAVSEVMEDAAKEAIVREVDLHIEHAGRIAVLENMLSESRYDSVAGGVHQVYVKKGEDEVVEFSAHFEDCPVLSDYEGFLIVVDEPDDVFLSAVEETTGLPQYLRPGQVGRICKGESVNDVLGQ